MKKYILVGKTLFCCALFFVFLVSFSRKKIVEHEDVPADVKKEIVFGMSGMFKGAFKLYADIIKNAITICFKRINNEGGLREKKLRLVAVDDSGDPLVAHENIESMQKSGIDMFIGNMGTRSLLKVLDKIKKGEIVMFFPWSGSSELRNKGLEFIVNGPGLLSAQVEKIVDHVEKNIKQKRVAIFCADDSFSQQGAVYLETLLKEKGMPSLATVFYNRHTLNIYKKTFELLDVDPKIVICLGTSMPIVRLIKRFFQHGHYNTKFFGIDSAMFVGNILHDVGVDFMYTSAVPDPKSSKIRIAEMYREDMNNYNKDEPINILSFVYYISAMIIVDAMKNIPEDIALTKENIIKAIQKMDLYNLHGFVVDFNSENRHAYGSDVSLIKG
jgi:branched-chain amino acid transport system substrate-binding protein